MLDIHCRLKLGMLKIGSENLKYLNFCPLIKNRRVFIRRWLGAYLVQFQTPTQIGRVGKERSAITDRGWGLWGVKISMWAVDVQLFMWGMSKALK